MKSDSQKPDFEACLGYYEFARRICHSERYIWSQEVNHFLQTVLATSGDRKMPIQEGTKFYRAQRGVDEIVDEEQGIFEVLGHEAKRMKPRFGQAREGRVNALGIPVLYLASTEQAAVSEVRPWIGTDVSVAVCKIKRDLKIINLMPGHDVDPLSDFVIDGVNENSELKAERKKKTMWNNIDRAFSNPVTRSDKHADYAPTQVLADLFRQEGYDGVAYRSSFDEFDERVHNIALFNLNDAEITGCKPVRIKKIKIKMSQIGNPWSRIN